MGNLNEEISRIKSIMGVITESEKFGMSDTFKKLKKTIEVLKEKDKVGLIGMDIRHFLINIARDDEFAKKWGELGSVYGKQWRNWEGKGDYRLPDKVSDWVYTESGLPVTKYQPKHIDQIANLISELKTNPDSRRLMVNAWNVGELDHMVLPPCHYGFQVYTRELCNSERRDWVIKNRSQQMPKFFDRLGWEGNVDEVLEKFNAPTRAISLMWNQRSVDTFLGLPFNIASYALLLHIIAEAVNMIPDELIGNLGDVHLYNNHIEQAKEQISRTPYELPTLRLPHYTLGIWDYEISDIVDELINYQSHPAIKAPLSN